MKPTQIIVSRKSPFHESHLQASKHHHFILAGLFEIGFHHVTDLNGYLQSDNK